MYRDLYKRMKEVRVKEKENAKEFKKFNVKDIEYIGKIDLTEDVNGVETRIQKDIYKVLEEMTNGKIVENYYDENREFVAGRDENGRMCLAEQSRFKDTNILEQINNLREQAGISLNNIEKEIEKIAKDNGIKKEEAEKMLEYIEQEDEKENKEDNLDEYSKDTEYEDKENKETEQEQEQEQIKEDEPQEIPEEEVQKMGISGMNEVDINAPTDTKGTTIAKELNMEGYSKIVVVHSYKLSEVTNENGEKGTRNKLQLGLIAKKSDGTYTTIPGLEVYRGSNNEMLKINDKNDAEIKREENIYQIRGTNKRMVISQSTSKDNPYGKPQVYLAQNTLNNDGNVAERLQDAYDGTQRQDVEVRELFNKTKGKNQADNMRDEVKGHTDNGCENLEKEDRDGNIDTGSHKHLENDEHSAYDKTEVINEIRSYDGEGSEMIEAFSDEELEGYLISESKKHPEMNKEQLINRTIEDISSERIHSPIPKDTHNI